MKSTSNWKRLKSLTDLQLVHDPAVDFIFPISSLTMLEEMANRVNEDPRYRGALVIFKQYGNQELRNYILLPHDILRDEHFPILWTRRRGEVPSCEKYLPMKFSTVWGQRLLAPCAATKRVLWSSSCEVMECSIHLQRLLIYSCNLQINGVKGIGEPAVSTNLSWTRSLCLKEGPERMGIKLMT